MSFLKNLSRNKEQSWQVQSRSLLRVNIPILRVFILYGSILLPVPTVLYLLLTKNMTKLKIGCKLSEMTYFKTRDSLYKFKSTLNNYTIYSLIDGYSLYKYIFNLLY